MTPSDVVTIKQSLRGRWIDALSAIGGIDPKILDGKGHPCPKCNGTDRFSLAWPEEGGLLCRQCFNKRNSDGLSALSWLTGKKFPEVVESLKEFLGINNGKVNGNGKPSGNGQKIEAPSKTDQTKSQPQGVLKPSDAVAFFSKKFGKHSAAWTYNAADGKGIGLIVRWDTPAGKEIRPFSLIDGKWVARGMPEPRPLYQLTAIPNAQRVYVCEGEKAADAARSIDLTATTSPHGSKSAGKADWTSLAGKDVVILPDNDAAGKTYCETVKAILAKLTPAPMVKVVELPGLPEAGDMADWVKAHGDAAKPEEMRRQIEALVDATAAEKSIAEKTISFVTVTPGTLVKAGDRDNFGTVLADNGETCTVHFVSPEGSTADKELPKSQLTTSEGKPLTTGGESTEPPAFTKTYSTEEFLGLDLSTEYLIEHVLARGQQCGMGGRSKTLKTSLALDAAISLGSGTAFLCRFTTKRVKVGFWSGESGAATIRRNALQIASSREIELRECSIDWGFDLPKLSKPAHLAALQDVITAKKLDVVFIDPLYLSLLSAETAGRPGDLFFMGSILEPLTALMQSTGVTIILLHHFRKNGFIDDSEPAGIEEFSMSGIAEWCRQWILLQRRSPYQSDGRHELWMRTGGSAGHSGLWALNIDEGQPNSRKWEVDIQPVSDARAEAKRAKNQRKAEELEFKEGEYRQRLLEVLKNRPRGESARVLKQESGLNTANFGKAITTLLKEGRAESLEMKKGGQKCTGYIPKN